MDLQEVGRSFLFRVLKTDKRWLNDAAALVRPPELADVDV